MKKLFLTFLCGVTVTLVCVGLLIAPWWHGFVSPTRNAQCLPPGYPEFAFDAPHNDEKLQPYIPYVLRVESPIIPIKEFYDNLIGDSGRGDSEQVVWVRREVRSGEYLYECHAALNWEEMERGCVYLREREGETVVERIWLYSATAAPTCETYMSELPSS